MYKEIRFIIMVVFTKLIYSTVARGNETFRINGIFPIINDIVTPLKFHRSMNFQSGFMMKEAMNYAVKKINDKEGFLYGYKLGVHTTFNFNHNLLKSHVLSTFLNHIPFLIGPHTSETSYITGILTGTFRQVVISYGATYSDFDGNGPSQGHMFRTVPSDRFRVQATLDLIGSLGWNYIAVINSFGYDGEREAKNFISKLSLINICLADSFDLPSRPVTQHYREAISTLSLDNRLKAIVMFTTTDDSKYILEAIQTLNLQDRFHLLCVYGCTNYIEVVKENQRSALGTISLDVHHPENLDFKEYFLSQNPWNNPDFKPLWERLFNCSAGRELGGYERFCSKENKLSVGNGYYPITPVHAVIDAIDSVGKSVRTLVEIFCPNRSTSFRNNSTEIPACMINASIRSQYSSSLFKMLRDMAHKDGTLKTNSSKIVQYDIHNFDRVNGTYGNFLIGTWKVKRSDSHNYAYYTKMFPKKFINFTMLDKKITLGNGSRIQPIAVCSSSCPDAHVRVPDANAIKAKCCWTCKKCPANSFALNDTCKTCRDTEMAVHVLKKCSSLPERSIRVEDTLSMLFVFLTTAGLCLTTVIVVLFIRFNNHYIIRSSGRDLSYMILLGIVLTFTCPLTYLTKPTAVSCSFRGTLPGLAFLICYAPLFLKTNRIYRIFQNAKTSLSRPSLISPQSQLIALLGIVFIQILLTGVWFASKMPAPSQVVSEDKTFITLHCNGDTSPTLLFLNVAFSVIFMISCTVLAFKTRHFPKNYNEAKYIGVTLYITCVAWAVFLPANFLAAGREDIFLQEYLMCSISIVIGYVTLFGLFGQKVKILFSPTLPELNKRPQMLSLNTSKKAYLEREISSVQDFKTDDNMLTPPIARSTAIMTNGNTQIIKEI